MRPDDATKELFLEALELGEAERAGLLAELRAARPESAGRLERLLRAHAGRTAAELEGTSGVAALVARLASDGGGRPGTVLADYELEEEIAAGASGVVWRARQRSLGRSVALKVLRAGRFAGAREVARFRAEAELVASLSHPNIVPVYEVGEHEGRHFFSMRYFAGGSLAERIGPEQLWPPRAAAELVATIARAVQHAHQRGLLHRDLKPSNVLLDEHGAPCVADFGIARPIDAEGVAAVTATLAGTPAYMAPEQTAPGLGEQTVATDVWALGCILYELLAGQPPFSTDGESMSEVLRKVREEEPFPLGALRPDAPGDLETIALRCLAKEPARRYASAEAVAVDLERWLAHEPILARRTGPIERTYLAWRRNPWVASLAALVLLLVVALAVGATWASVKLSARLRDAYFEQARATRLSETPGRRSAALALLAQASAIRPGPDLRDEAIASLALTDLTPELSVPLERFPEAQVPRLSPSLQLLAVTLPEGGFDVLAFPPPETGEARPVLQVRTPLPGQSDLARCMGVRFSPDERFVCARFHRLNAFTTDASFAVWDLASGALLLHEPEATANQAFDFHPDGTLLVGTQAGRLLRFDLSTGECLSELALGGRIDCLRFSDDGASVAIGVVVEVGGSEHDRLEVRSAASLVLESRATLPALVWVVDWTPDGEVIAGCGDFHAYVFGRDRQEPRLTLAGHSAEVVQVLASRTAALVVTSSWDGTARLWSTETGEELLRLSAEALVISPDGKRLACRTSEELGVWRIEYGEVLRTLRGHGGKGPERVVFSRDGAQFVSSGLDGALLWSTEPGQQQARLVTEKCDGVAFLPDGERLWLAYTAGLEARSLSAPEAPGRFLIAGVANDLALTADGRTAVLRQGRALHLFDPEHPEQARTVSVQQGANEVVISRLGSYVAVGSWKGAGVMLLRASDGEVLAHLLQDQDFTSALFAPDESTLVVGDGYHYELLGLPGLEPRGRIAYEGSMRGTPIAMAFSPDGARIALALDLRRIGLYDARTLAALAVLESPRSASFWHLAFSPDGRLLASSSPSNEIRLWDLVLLERELERHELSGRRTVPQQIVTSFPRRAQ